MFENEAVRSGSERGTRGGKVSLPAFPAEVATTKEVWSNESVTEVQKEECQKEDGVSLGETPGAIEATPAGTRRKDPGLVEEDYRSFLEYAESNDDPRMRRTFAFFGEVLNMPLKDIKEHFTPGDIGRVASDVEPFYLRYREAEDAKMAAFRRIPKDPDDTAYEELYARYNDLHEQGNAEYEAMQRELVALFGESSPQLKGLTVFDWE